MEIRSRARTNRLIALGLLIAMSVTAAVLAAQWARFYLLCVNNSLWPDQWYMVEDLEDWRAGRINWAHLWAPYWGQRIPLPRLLFWVWERFWRCDNRPLLMINVGCLGAMFLVIANICRKLFRSGPYVLTFVLVTLLTILATPFPWEALIQGMAVQYTIGYGAAMLAIAVYGGALNPEAKSSWRFVLALLFAAASTACLIIGLLVWPVLFFEACAIRKPAQRKQAIVFGILAVVLPVLYSLHYVREPGEVGGMGLAGMLRQPGRAFHIFALITGGPLSFLHPRTGTIAGAVGTLTVICLSVLVARAGWQRYPALATSLFLCLFLLGSSGSIVAGRLGSRFLADANPGQYIPSRYLLAPILFWAILFPASIAGWRWGAPLRVLACAVTLVVLYVAFGTWQTQMQIAGGWARMFQGLDAIEAGFLLDVPDQEYMLRLNGEEPTRRRVVKYLREHHLNVFTEARAAWPGSSVSAIASANRRDRCELVIFHNVPIAPPNYRIVGRLKENGRQPSTVLDLVTTDERGTVAGMARTLPVQSESRQGTDFFGYTRETAGTLPRFYLLDHGAVLCAAREGPAEP